MSPWPAVTLTTPKQQSLRPNRNPMLRGYSQDVDTATETSRRRTALLRIRDRSYDIDEQPSARFPSYQQFEELAWHRFRDVIFCYKTRCLYALFFQHNAIKLSVFSANAKLETQNYASLVNNHTQLCSSFFLVWLVRWNSVRWVNRW